ncbi:MULTISPECIES: G-D-S-L family lipolytic protein [Flavobacterium]|uniref:G-D-S-L family lipolytic protein n=1 Tax=Flavobacterium jumunjinense TaxID=998845 RepID=A0ABV5GTR6_9FLAO|nr:MULTISPECIES: G-D-S-L family lipolytic protein [Flavobacterium]
MKNKFIYLAILAAGFISCEPEFENEVDADYTNGNANFSSYVAVGNSLTAGYMDGTVYKSGQMNSFPNLLAQKFSLVGGGAFTQPSYEEDVNDLGGISGIPGFGTRLVIDASQGRPENLAGTPTITLTPQATAYNNMGVPGAKSFHLLAAGYGNVANLPNANPFYIRHATSATSTVLGDAMSKNPTFFTNWIGANDVLSYATNGGAQADGVTPAVDHNVTGNLDPSTYGSNDITNSTAFGGVYTQIVNTLTSNGAKGVVATIPSVTSIPYFTTVPYNALPAEATSSNATAVALYQFLALATGGRIAPLNTAAGTKNPVLIRDEDLTDIGGTIQAFAAGSGNPLLVSNAAALGALYGKARHTTANDLMILPSSSVIGQPSATGTAPFNVNGVTLPLANRWVLTSNEKTKVQNAITAYNAAIVSIANSKGLAIADMNAILGQLVTGLRVDSGQFYTANYFSGSATENKVLFSLDGVHPNARGYAVITNEIIKVINQHYGSKMPLYYPSFFQGIHIVATN